MKFKPLHDRVLVKRTDTLEKTESGLFIPPTAQDKPNEAIVVSVGDGRVLDDGTLKTVDVSPGDKVLFGKYSGSELTIDKIEHLILREDEILGIVYGEVGDQVAV